MITHLHTFAHIHPHSISETLGGWPMFRNRHIPLNWFRPSPKKVSPCSKPPWTQPHQCGQARHHGRRRNGARRRQSPSPAACQILQKQPAGGRFLTPLAIRLRGAEKIQDKYASIQRKSQTSCCLWTWNLTSARIKRIATTQDWLKLRFPFKRYHGFLWNYRFREQRPFRS